MFRKTAFGVGLALGLASFIFVGTGILAYLLTGKIPFIEMEEGGWPAFRLLAPQELAALIKEQITRPLPRYGEREASEAQ